MSCGCVPCHRSQTCHGEGACITQRSYEPWHAGPPKMDRSQWRVLTKRGPLEEGIANHSSILAVKTPWTVWKGKKIWHQKMSPQVGRCPIGYWEERRSITNNSRKNDASGPKWKWRSVVDMSAGESKVQCCKEQCCIGTGTLGLWIKVNWIRLSGRW